MAQWKSDEVSSIRWWPWQQTHLMRYRIDILVTTTNLFIFFFSLQCHIPSRHIYAKNTCSFTTTQRSEKNTKQSRKHTHKNATLSQQQMKQKIMSIPIVIHLCPIIFRLLYCCLDMQSASQSVSQPARLSLSPSQKWREKNTKCAIFLRLTIVSNVLCRCDLFYLPFFSPAQWDRQVFDWKIV